MGLESASFLSDLNSSWPLGSDNKTQGDDHLRLLKSILQATFPGADLPFYLSADRADVASATTTDIGAATTQYVNITGTTTITGLGTANAGVWRLIRFNAALTLTHNASALILPTAANITTVAGDHAFAFSRGSGNWQVLWYVRANGSALSIANLQASNAEVVAETDVTEFVAPDQLKYTPGAAKAWGYVDTDGTLLAGYNITSSAKNSTGFYTVTLENDMDSANYAVVATVVSTAADRAAHVSSVAAGSFNIRTIDTNEGALQDGQFMFAVYGTLA